MTTDTNTATHEFNNNGMDTMHPTASNDAYSRDPRVRQSAENDEREESETLGYLEEQSMVLPLDMLDLAFPQPEVLLRQQAPEGFLQEVAHSNVSQEERERRYGELVRENEYRLSRDVHMRTGGAWIERFIAKLSIAWFYALRIGLHLRRPNFNARWASPLAGRNCFLPHFQDDDDDEPEEEEEEEEPESDAATQDTELHANPILRQMMGNDFAVERTIPDDHHLDFTVTRPEGGMVLQFSEDAMFDDDFLQMIMADDRRRADEMRQREEYIREMTEQGLFYEDGCFEICELVRNQEYRQAPRDDIDRLAEAVGDVAWLVPKSRSHMRKLYAAIRKVPRRHAKIEAHLRATERDDAFTAAPELWTTAPRFMLRLVDHVRTSFWMRTDEPLRHIVSAPAAGSV